MSARKPLTVERLRALLAKNQLRQCDLAWMAGVSDRQARAWCCGETDIPQYVTLLLVAYDQKLLKDEWLIRQIAEPVP